MSTTDFAYKIELIGRNDPSLVKTWIDVVQNQGDVRQVATALASNTRLRVLRLHFWPATADHTTDEQAAQELASVIAETKLEGLVIAWKEFRQSSSSSFQYYEAILAKCLLEAVQKSLTIRDLNLLHGVGCMTTLIECLPKLRKLCIVGSSTTPERLLHPLFQSLCQSTTLTTLAIQGIQFNEQDMKVLSKGLAEHSSVTKLLLDQCSICDNGVEAFLQYWHLQSPIRHLEWTNNLICATGATMLIKSASNRNAMETLNLSGNAKIGYEGLVCIALEIPNMILKELKVASCVVPPQQPTCKSDTDSDGSSEASQLLSQLVLQGLAANTQLLELNVLCNGIDTVTPNFQREYQLYTFRNRLFQWMTMSSSSSSSSSRLLPFGIWCHIFAKYTHNPSCILLFLKEQPVLILQAVAPPRGELEEEEDGHEEKAGPEDDWVLL